MNTDKIPVLYEKDRPQAVFTKAFNIITVAEVNAESYLEFDLYFTDRKREYIKNQADKVIYMSKEYEKDCMLMRNKFMVDNSNFVIAMWDGRKYGGTFYTLKCAEKLNKQIILVDCLQSLYTTKDIYGIERERK